MHLVFEILIQGDDYRDKDYYYLWAVPFYLIGVTLPTSPGLMDLVTDEESKQLATAIREAKQAVSKKKESYYRQ